MLTLVQSLAENIQDVEELGDLPKSLLNRLSQILSRKRFVTSKTLGLFLSPDNDTIDVYDCGSELVYAISNARIAD